MIIAEVALQDAVAHKAPSRNAPPAATASGSRLSVLLEHALQRRIVKPDEAERLRELQTARSAVVHAADEPEAGPATELVERTLSAVERIRRPKSQPSAAASS